MDAGIRVVDEMLVAGALDRGLLAPRLVQCGEEPSQAQARAARDGVEQDGEMDSDWNRSIV
jgi:hypothetical protein